MRIKAPGIYIQEMELLENVGRHVYPVSGYFFVIVENRIYGQMGTVIKKSLDKANIRYEIVIIEGVCTDKRAKQYAGECICFQCGGVLGIGSGGIIDLAKAVGYYAQVPVVVVPTLASSDAACSSISALYKENGVFDQYLKLRVCPGMVLVDSEIIANAPARFLTAGMADGLATYLENKILYEAEIAGKITRNTISSTILSISKQCYHTILENGLQALEDVNRHICTDEVEKIIEANIYMSGIGFENGGLAAAHSIANGITYLEELSVLHGEAVAVGILAQMILSGESQEEFETIKEFFMKVNLPTCLSDLGVTDIRTASELIAKPASASYASNQILLFSMRYEMIAGALMALEFPE